MLAPGTGKGKKPFNAINFIANGYFDNDTDPQQKLIIESNLTTRLKSSFHGQELAGVYV